MGKNSILLPVASALEQMVNKASFMWPHFVGHFRDGDGEEGIQFLLGALLVPLIYQ